MSRHFTIAEMTRSKRAQELGIDNTPPVQVLGQLEFTMAGAERVRAFLGLPMIITSGYRSAELNAAVKGSKTSQHMIGQAIDFTCPGFGSGPHDVAHALAQRMEILGIDQLILENGWVHVSFSLSPRYQALRYLGGGKYEGLA